MTQPNNPPEIAPTATILAELLKRYRDQQATINVDGLTINVTIKDSRIRFGHLDVLVVPVNGSGQKWMEHHKVTLTAI